MLPETDLNACCAVSYSHPLARRLLGDSFHPGGLALTTRLVGLMDIGPDSRVLDAGSGLGASAVHLARTTGCHVTGVTLEAEGVAAGLELAQRHGVEGRVTLLQGDILEADLARGSFDAVLMECVLSILPRKIEALDRLYELLRPGGHLGLTDVTLNGSLPQHLQGVLAVVGCLGDARSLEEYRRLAEAEGFTVEQSQDVSEALSSFLRDIKRKLLLAEVASKLGKLPVSGELLTEGKRLLASTEEQVHQGVLGYGLLVARKPA